MGPCRAGRGGVDMGSDNAPLRWGKDTHDKVLPRHVAIPKINVLKYLHIYI